MHICCEDAFHDFADGGRSLALGLRFSSITDHHVRAAIAHTSCWRFETCTAATRIAHEQDYHGKQYRPLLDGNA